MRLRDQHGLLYIAEVKIVYAVNPNMPTQLYEVDVFMFFLKDLEAVSNNFYHDLWQVARLHTPKVSFCRLMHLDVCAAMQPRMKFMLC